MFNGRPHAPLLEYLCCDPDCCDNGCPRVSCRSCGEDWPCADWRSRHTDKQVIAQRRYVHNKTHPGDPRMVEYELRRDAEVSATGKRPRRSPPA